MKKIFFTEEFYQYPNLTLDILNELIATNYVADREMYQDGTFIFMEVYENDTTKELLSKVISDLGLYKEFNKENFATDEETQISLCALQYEHTIFFGNEKEIKWDDKAEQFVFSDYENEEIKTEKNAGIVSLFMEHCKISGLKIPESMFESFFDV